MFDQAFFRSLTVLLFASPTTLIIKQKFHEFIDLICVEATADRKAIKKIFDETLWTVTWPPKNRPMLWSLVRQKQGGKTNDVYRQDRTRPSMTVISFFESFCHVLRKMKRLSISVWWHQPKPDCWKPWRKAIPIHDDVHIWTERSRKSQRWVWASNFRRDSAILVLSKRSTAYRNCREFAETKSFMTSSNLMRPLSFNTQRERESYWMVLPLVVSRHERVVLTIQHSIDISVTILVTLALFFTFSCISKRVSVSNQWPLSVFQTTHPAYLHYCSILKGKSDFVYYRFTWRRIPMATDEQGRWLCVVYSQSSKRAWCCGTCVSFEVETSEFQKVSSGEST